MAHRREQGGPAFLGSMFTFREESTNGRLLGPSTKAPQLPKVCQQHSKFVEDVMLVLKGVTRVYSICFPPKLQAGAYPLDNLPPVLFSQSSYRWTSCCPSPLLLSSYVLSAVLSNRIQRNGNHKIWRVVHLKHEGGHYSADESRHTKL